MDNTIKPTQTYSIFDWTDTKVYIDNKYVHAMSISYDLYPGEVAGNIDCLLSFPPQVVIPERHDMRKHRLKVLCLNEYGQGACLLDADVVFISVTGKVTNTNEPLTFSIQYQGDRSRFLSELTEEDIALMCPKATSRT